MPMSLGEGAGARLFIAGLNWRSHVISRVLVGGRMLVSVRYGH
jgi:hypothetical protein